MADRPIPSLDGLRAVSVLVVMISHLDFIPATDTMPGGFGVTVFFFLSGYLITTLMRVEFARTGEVNLKQFWIRRGLRILPAFYLVLVIATVAAWIFEPPGATTPGALAALYFHMTNYWIVFRGYEGQPPGTGVYWSLAVEEHFYLLFPWFFIAMQKWQLSARNQALTLWGLCLLVLVWRCILIFALGSSEMHTYHATDTRVDSILFGCALAVWHNPTLDPPRLSARLWKRFLVPAAFAVLLLCFIWRDHDFRETARYTLQGIALTFVFIAAIRWPGELPWRWLNLRTMVFIGVLSYSLYLVHYPIIFAVNGHLGSWPSWAQATLAFSLSFVASWLIYRYIERPIAKLRKRHSPGQPATGSAKTASAERAAVPSAGSEA